MIDVGGPLAYYSQPYNIKCWSDVYLPDDATEVIVRDGKCNDISSFDLSIYTELRSIIIGDECFMNVNELHIEGLTKLESVTIGMNSFTQYKNSYGSNSNRKFYLRNCPLLKELRIGRYSFSDYMYSYVENLESIELVEFGDVSENSYNFHYARYASFLSN